MRKLIEKIMQIYKEADQGHDYDNPRYILSSVSNDLLLKIARGELELNIEAMARIELANRGVDKNGNSVPFHISINWLQD